jgi:hypothetical protein
LKRLIGDARLHFSRRHMPQLLVDQRNQLLTGVGHRLQTLRDIAHDRKTSPARRAGHSESRALSGDVIDFADKFR